MSISNSSEASKSALRAKAARKAARDKQVKMATGIAHDKRYAGGNMTGAVSAIEKIRRQLSKGHQRATALMAANEEEEQVDETFGGYAAKHTGEPPKGTIAYDRKYGPYTAQGDLRKRPNPNKPPKAENEETDDAGWYAHKEIHGSKGISKEDWKKGYRMNSKGARVMTKEEVDKLSEESNPVYSHQIAKEIAKSHPNLTTTRGINGEHFVHHKDDPDGEGSTLSVRRRGHEFHLTHESGGAAGYHHETHKTAKSAIASGIEIVNGTSPKVNEEQVDEVLGKGATAADYIHDFVNSKNPKFDGKSKKERIRMALGAAYAARNDDADDTDEAYFDGKLRSGPEWGTAKKSQAKVNAIIRGREEDKEMRAYNKAQRLKRNLLKKEEVEEVDESPNTHGRYSGSVGHKEFSVIVPGHKDSGYLNLNNPEVSHRLIRKQNPHLEHHEVTAIVNSDGDKNSKQTVEHKGKTYTHHVVNQGRRLVRFHYPEPDLKDDVNYTDSSIDEASKKKALGFKQKGNIFRMKNKTIRKFATSGSRDLHTLLGISQRKRRMGQKINAELEEKEMDVVEPAGPPSVEHQLRKSVSLRGMHPVAFENGETHKVPSHVAQHATSMIQDTPIQHGQREAFIKKLNASPESFYKHIGLKKPQA